MNGWYNILAISKNPETRFKSKPSSLDTQINNSRGKLTHWITEGIVKADLEQQMENILTQAILKSTCYDIAHKFWFVLVVHRIMVYYWLTTNLQCKGMYKLAMTESFIFSLIILYSLLDKTITTLGKKVSVKLDFKLEKELKKVQKQGRDERTQEDYPTSAKIHTRCRVVFLRSFISALFLCFFQLHP